MASGLENIETIESPFRRFVTTIGIFPTAFTDAMTYYECLAYLVKYLEDTVIPAVNENAEALEELQQYYIQLKSYVENYFANLDVQEEINSKLDQMAEDGTLQEIITAYIQANVAWTFDNVADMKTVTNLVNGSYAQTLGYHAKNDGGAGLYKIRTIINDDVVDEATIIELADDSLIAELIFDENIRPKQFGAYGDGSHDDVISIQKAITYACSHNGVVSFDSGKYNVSDSLTIPSSIKIEGTYAKGDSTTSIKGTEILITSNNKAIFKFSSGVSYYQCEFKNLRLNATNTTGSKGIDTSDATLFSESIIDSVYFNGGFDVAINFTTTGITTIRNCAFSANNKAFNLVTTNTALYVENCNFWNNAQDVCCTGNLENAYFDKCHFENTNGDTTITFIAPVSLSSCAIRNCEILNNTSDNAIFFNGANTANYVRLNAFLIENTNIAAKTGIKIDMVNNTAPNNALANSFLNNVTFLKCTGYGIDSNYQYTYFALNNCICYNNWYYGSGTLVNHTTNNYIREYSNSIGLTIESPLTFKYVNSLIVSANSLYTDNTNTLKWRFNDTSKTAPIAMIKLGSSTNRPASPIAGEMYYDWTISKPIWWTGTTWIDATGASV